MLNYILHNLDRYPLDGVVHFELEIDYPFIHNVIDYMETECKRAGIQFVRIKPRKTWEELYDKCGFPTRKIRWCNGHYKLDAKRQLSKWLNEVGFYVVHYKMKAGKAHGFNRGMIGRQSRFSWNKIRAKEFHCVSSGRNWRIIFLRSECVQTVNKTLFGLFLH